MSILFQISSMSKRKIWYATEVSHRTIPNSLGAHHGCGPFRGPVCATRRFHLGTDGSKGLYRNQAENKQQTETFVLIHAWRCSVEWMDGKVATLCESIFPWVVTLRIPTHCFSCYWWYPCCLRGWCGNSTWIWGWGFLAGFLRNIGGPTHHFLKKPRLGTRIWKHVPFSKRYHVS